MLELTLPCGNLLITFFQRYALAGKVYDPNSAFYPTRGSEWQKKSLDWNLITGKRVARELLFGKIITFLPNNSMFLFNHSSFVSIRWMQKQLAHQGLACVRVTWSKMLGAAPWANGAVKKPAWAHWDVSVTDTPKRAVFQGHRDARPQLYKLLAVLNISWASVSHIPSKYFLNAFESIKTSFVLH